MALVPCKNCNKNISSSAKKCPHCGIDNIIDSAVANKEPLTNNILSDAGQSNKPKISNLVPCQKCRKLISRSAKKCPHCELICATETLKINIPVSADYSENIVNKSNIAMNKFTTLIELSGLKNVNQSKTLLLPSWIFGLLLLLAGFFSSPAYEMLPCIRISFYKNILVSIFIIMILIILPISSRCIEKLFKFKWTVMSKTLTVLCLYFLFYYFGQIDYKYINFMFSVKKGDIAEVKKIINTGINVNIKNNIGWTALNQASADGNNKIVELLLSKGVDINAKDNDGMTALTWAAQKGNDKIVELLLSRGTDINAKDNDGMSVLQWASFEGHEKIVELLLDKGANINAKDKFGSTALMDASGNGHEKVVGILLSKGADASIKNNNGSTALSFAKYKKNNKIVNMLMEYAQNKISKLNKDNSNKSSQNNTSKEDIPENPVVPLTELVDTQSNQIEGFKSLKIGKNLDECLKSGGFIKDKAKEANYDITLTYDNILVSLENNKIDLKEIVGEQSKYILDDKLDNNDITMYDILDQGDLIKIGNTTVKITCFTFKNEVILIEGHPNVSSDDFINIFKEKYGEPFLIGNDNKFARGDFPGTSTVYKYPAGAWKTNDTYLLAFTYSEPRFFIVNFKKLRAILQNLTEITFKKRKDHEKKLEEENKQAVKETAKDL